MLITIAPNGAESPIITIACPHCDAQRTFVFDVPLSALVDATCTLQAQQPTLSYDDAHARVLASALRLFADLCADAVALDHLCPLLCLFCLRARAIDAHDPYCSLECGLDAARS